MAQFILKTSNNRLIYPSEIDKNERKKLYEECKKGLCLYCNCNGKIEYKISDGSQSQRWAIYPSSKGKQMEHEEWCPKSRIYLSKRDYNKGFIVDDESGEVKVHLSEPLTHRESNKRKISGNEYGHNEVNGKQYPHFQQGEITISAMIKKMNMLTFRHVAFYKTTNEADYPTTDIMVRRKIYWATKRTRIGRRKCIADFNCRTDNIEFVYKELAEVPPYDVESRITRLLTKEKTSTGETVSIPVYTKELNRALVEYQDTYATNDLTNRNIIFAGFRDRFAMYSLRFLLVNDYGLFSESNYEVQMYNAICEIMNQNSFKEKGVYFYKPFEYGYGAYEDKYLEDGIIEFEGTNRKIIIEVYGRNDELYLKRKEIKTKMLSLKNNIYTYIPWEAYKNEPLPYNEICNAISEILKERG